VLFPSPSVAPTKTGVRWIHASSLHPYKSQRLVCRQCNWLYAACARQDRRGIDNEQFVPKEETLDRSKVKGCRCHNYDMGNSSNGNLVNALDSALIQLLTKNSLSILMDREVLDNVLKYTYGRSTGRIGDLLIRHPTAVTALLNNLYGPKHRICQLETSLKCTRLVALAVTASERAAGLSPGNQVKVTESNKDVLSEVILKRSQLCKQLETWYPSQSSTKSTKIRRGPSGDSLASCASSIRGLPRGVD
jgi:hypothetical protein